MRQSNDILNYAIPGVIQEHSHIRPVALRCIASVIYHLDWLRKHLPATHPLWANQLIASGYAEEIKSYVFSGLNSPLMSATGVPNAAIMYEKFDRQSKQLDTLTDLVKNGGSGGCGGVNNMLLAKLEEMKEEMMQWKSDIQERFDAGMNSRCGPNSSHTT